MLSQERHRMSGSAQHHLDKLQNAHKYSNMTYFAIAYTFRNILTQNECLQGKEIGMCSWERMRIIHKNTV